MNFIFQSLQVPSPPAITATLKADISEPIRSSTIAGVSREACLEFVARASNESPIPCVIDVEEDISTISNDFDGPCNFSQIEEVILIDSDDEEDYYSQRLSQEVQVMKNND